MKIYNKYFKIEIINKEIYFDLNKIVFDNYCDLFIKLNEFIGEKKKDTLLLDGEYEPLNHLEQLSLLVLSNYYKDIYSIKYDKYLDITFSYNFPIIKQRWIISRLLKLSDKAFDTNMITLADSNDYLEIDVSNKNEYNAFYKRFGRLIRKGDNKFEVKMNKLCDTLDNWNSYCKKKHNKSFSYEALEIYNDIYNTFGFYSIKILYKDEEIVNTVCFKDCTNKILYFCILSWNEKYKKLSPGIYTYAKGIEYCYNNGYNFSFCYGMQEYKKNMISNFGVKCE